MTERGLNFLFLTPDIWKLTRNKHDFVTQLKCVTFEYKEEFSQCLLLIIKMYHSLNKSLL